MGLAGFLTQPNRSKLLFVGFPDGLVAEIERCALKTGDAPCGTCVPGAGLLGCQAGCLPVEDPASAFPAPTSMCCVPVLSWVSLLRGDRGGLQRQQRGLGAVGEERGWGGH